MTSNDEEMRAQVEEAVDMIRAAQHPDGYINSYYTTRGLSQRWTNLRDMHEMYCLGHLVEACVAYETLTGNGRLLQPVMKALQHVDSIFGSEPGKKRGYPGHEEIEIGLLRLYELTGEQLLLKMAKYFILERGQRDHNGETFFDHEAKARGGDPYDHMGPEMRTCYRKPRDYGYHQADFPIKEVTEVKGHSVRAMYYYTAATDYVRLTGDTEVKDALDRLWRNLVDKKLYVTGGVGAIRQWEGFGPDYLLGDAEEGGTCYAETCASFALIIWCSKMLRLELRSQYADIMEVALYNGFLGAVGLDGVAFYYQNPLRTYMGHPKPRNTWFEVACCPPNVAKLLGQLGTLIYGLKEDLVVVHLYIESNLTVPGQNCTISQKTSMPWSGDVEINVRGTAKLALRIPSWAKDYTVSVQAESKDGYLYLPPVTDTSIKLDFHMEARKIYAHPMTGKDEVCIQRGPLIYCIEDVDNEVDVDNIALTDKKLEVGEPLKIMNVDQVVTILARGKELADLGGPALYRTEPWRYEDRERVLKYVPFFLRANRGGDGGMRVWVKRVGGGS